MSAEADASNFPQGFRFYLLARFAAGAALTCLRSAVAWHVFALSGSAFQLGLVGLLQFAPALLLTLVGGAVADRFDRRRIMRLAQLPPLACGATLALLVTRDAVGLPGLYLAVVLVASAAAFDQPARAAFLPSLVSRAAFPRAVTYATTTQALAFVTGPALAGLLIAEAGIGAAYALHASLVALAFAGLSLVPPPTAPAARSPVSVAAIREGLAFVRSRPLVLGCMTLDMFAVVFGGAGALLPIYANEILGVGARGYGALAASLEVGALVTSLVLLARPPLRRAGATLLAAVAVYGLATIVFGLSRSFPLSLLAYAAVGMADQVSVVLRQTLIQLSTPDALRGRVSAVNSVFIGASNQLGAAESGFLAGLTSATFAVVAGGLACLAVVGVVARTVPELRRARLGALEAPPPA